ncbi:hypothetical protein LCGC14_2876470, partial [marine sediment metagenome]
MPYAALTLREKETAHQAVCLFMHTAHDLGVGFK